MYNKFMTKQLLKEAIGWGILLWLIGYILGIVFFMFLPSSMIGWVIMPVGMVLVLWIILKMIRSNSLNHYFLLGLIWTVIAIVFDYFFLVKIFQPADGYYKLDVYLYYSLTFVLPLLVGWFKRQKKGPDK